MIMAIYKRAFSVLMKKPIRLWGISLLYALLASIGTALCGIAIPIFGLAVGLLLETSMTMIFLHGYRGEDDQVKAVNLFECFRDWATIKRVLCGMGWMLLWIFLWSLIPIVGIIFGIIRTYEYRLTPYILVMEPDVKPTEAIKLSKERTKGWKGKMFGADILVVVLFYVVFLILMLLSRIPFAGFLFAIILVLFVICFIALVGLFMGLVQAAFYEEIKKWGSYPGRAAYAPVPPVPGPGYPPQGYGQQYNPQYGQQNPQQYDPQYGQPYPPQQPQPTWQPPQPVETPQPTEPLQPTWQPPEPPQQPAWQPPEPPAAPQPPEGWNEPPQE